MKPMQILSIPVAILLCLFWPILYLMAAMIAGSWTEGRKILNQAISDVFTWKDQ